MLYEVDDYNIFIINNNVCLIRLRVKLQYYVSRIMCRRIYELTNNELFVHSIDKVDSYTGYVHSSRHIRRNTRDY